MNLPEALAALTALQKEGEALKVVVVDGAGYDCEITHIDIDKQDVCIHLIAYEDPVINALASMVGVLVACAQEFGRLSTLGVAVAPECLEATKDGITRMLQFLQEDCEAHNIDLQALLQASIGPSNVG